MRAWLVLAVNVTALAALSISTVRFLVGGAVTRSERNDKRLAGLSAGFTLLTLCLIYSGEFKHAVLSVVGQETTGLGARTDWSRDLGHLDGFFTAIANFFKPGTDIGYRPSVTIWPAVLLLIIYLVRYAVYRLATRRKRAASALSATTYASHITAYLMAVAFMVVTLGWSIYFVVPVSLLVIACFVAGLKSLAEDLFHTLGAQLRVTSRWLRAAVAWLVLAFTEAADHVRMFVQKIDRSYLTTIREPLRRRSDEALKRAERLEERVQHRLEEQNKRIEARRREGRA